MGGADALVAFLHLGLAKLALLRHLDRRRRHVVRLAELRGRGGRGLGELPEERSHHTLAVIANTAAATGGAAVCTAAGAPAREELAR